MKQIELSEKQIDFINNAVHRWNGKIGATQCGKTFIDVSYVIPERIISRKGMPGLYLILGVTKETIERNVLEPMRDFWGVSLVGEINSRNIAKLFGEKVYCLGAEKITQVSKLRGAKFKYVYCDEIVEFNQDVFELLKSRLSLDYSVCDFTGNPSYPTHYIKNFINSGADVYCQNWTLYDNPFLPENYIRNLEKEYFGTVFYDRYILGQWKQAEGLVYPEWQSSVVKTIDRNYEEYQLSIDYGIQNPFAIGLYGLYGGVWYKVKEYHHSGKETNQEKTDGEYFDELKKFVGNLPIRKIIIDPSAKSFIVLLRRNRFTVVSADNDVIDGIRVTLSAMKQGKIKINDRCTESIKELGLYSWDKKSDAEKPIKQSDHHCDEMRYFCYTNKITQIQRKYYGEI